MFTFTKVTSQALSAVYAKLTANLSKVRGKAESIADLILQTGGRRKKCDIVANKTSLLFYGDFGRWASECSSNMTLRKETGRTQLFYILNSKS